MYWVNKEKLAINTLRVLAATAITNAKSGHPGVSLGAAAIMYELFVNHLNVSPTDYNHFNKDNFVLSCGHAAPLLYATMLLCGYKNICMNDLKHLRKLHAKTAGHPEPCLLENLDVGTGPLGQGIAMAVGLAISEKKLESLVNTNKINFKHYVYCLFGDGCLQEGVAYEAISLAGHYKLNNLIMFYDSNKIQLDSEVSASTSFNVKAFFKSMGWRYIYVKNGNDPLQIRRAILKAKHITNKKPTVIECRTIIGYGSVLANNNKVHGTPLSQEQLNTLIDKLDYPYKGFTISPALADLPEYVKKRVDKQNTSDFTLLNQIEKDDLDLYKKIATLLKVEKSNPYSSMQTWFENYKNKPINSTRAICGDILNIIANKCNNLIVVGCDVTSSTKVKVAKSVNITADNNFLGQNLPVGVREFAMSAIMNGITAGKKLKAIGSTFLSFLDYNKAAIRLAAVSQIPSINIFSHDSITVGEDGPTHQPIEQLWTLRSIPNHMVFRPCNYWDMVVAFKAALSNETTPTTIVTSRHDFAQIPCSYEMAKHGAYVVKKSNDKKAHDITIYATGSEVPLAIDVALKIKNKNVRVVAINSLELLAKQPLSYQKQIFDESIKISIEYGSTLGWYKYVDLPIGIETFGQSADASSLIKYLKLDASSIANKIVAWLKTKKIRR